MVTDDQIMEWAPLVTMIAASERRKRRIPTQSLDLDDLKQVGMIAVIENIEKFDPSRGVPLKTFLSQVIAWRVIDEIRKAAPEPRKKDPSKTYSVVVLSLHDPEIFDQALWCRHHNDRGADARRIRNKAEIALIADRLKRFPRIYRDVFFKSHHQLGITPQAYAQRRKTARNALAAGHTPRSAEQAIVDMTKHNPNSMLTAALRAKRKATSMRETMEALGSDRPNVYRIETQFSEASYIGTFIRICAFVGVSLDEGARLMRIPFTTDGEIEDQEGPESCTAA